MRTLCLALLFAGACTVGGLDDGTTPPPAGGPDAGSGGGDPTATEISGSVTESGVWSGTVSLVGDATIEAGVTIEVAAGTELHAANGVFLSVAGTLTTQGTAAEPVVLAPAEGAAGFGGVKVLAGGSAALVGVDATGGAMVLKCEAGALGCAIEDSHFHQIGQALVIETPGTIKRSRIEDMANAGISVKAGADLLIEDSYVLTSTHDIIVMGAGALTIDHSEIGGAQGSYEHCNFHISGAGSLSVTNSVILSGIYGIMIGGADGAVFNNNNFVENGAGQDVLDLGGATNIDLTQNYWDQGAPSLGAGYDTSNPLASPNPLAGPR